MTKQEQKTILDTIENIFSEKINTITEEKNVLKEKNLLQIEEIKTLKLKIKELETSKKTLEKELSIANKNVSKYEKIFESIKK